MRNQHLVLDRFRRVNDRTKPDLLGKDELTVLRDAVLDYKIGQPIKRGNFSRYDAAVSAGNDILTLKDVLVGSLFYLLAASGTAIARYDPVGNSWANLTGSYTAGFKFRMEHYKDKFIFIFDTDDDPRMIDSSALTAWDLDLGVADCTTVESFHDDGGNLEQDAFYKWVMVGVTDDGQLGVPSRPFTHFVDSDRRLTTSAASTMVCFTELPYIADSRITGRMIFRNQATNDMSASGGGNKSGEVYYHAVTLDNDSAGNDYQSEWEDNTADLDLGSDIVIYTNMPTRANYICQNRDRIFLGNFTQINRNFISPPSSYANSGTHTGADNQATVMTDASRAYVNPWTDDELIGRTIYNITDGSSGVVTDNDATTVTVAALSGGTGDDWDTDDIYDVGSYPTITTDGTYDVTDGSDSGEMLVIVEAYSAGATLVSGTQYDYKIHYGDRQGRLSKFYHEMSITLRASTTGTHDGGNNEATVMTDSGASFTTNEFVGLTIQNTTDVSEGVVTSNDGTTITCSGGLSGGTDDDWDTNDTYLISNQNRVQIKGIGRLDHVIALAYPNRLVFRQTGGSGDFDLIERGDVTSSAGYTFTDSGLAAKADNWADPDTNTIAHPARLLASDIESPSAFREENYIDIYPEDGDAITGQFDDLDGVIVFKEKSVCKAFTSGHLTNWNRVRLLDNVGCSEPETLQKRGDTYYFIYNGRAYRYRYGADAPENIGLLFQDTLDTIVTWHDSTINDEWYMIQVKDSTSFWTLVFDIKLNAWYQFSRQQDGSEDFKVLHIIRYGSDKDLILSNADDYVSQYNQPTVAARADTENGSTKQISPTVTTKTFEFPDGISKARLRELQFDYKKVSGQDTVITVTDEDGGATVAVTDNTGSGKKLYESGIGADGDSLKKARSLSIRVTGAGMEEWDNLRLEYRPIKEGL